MYVSSTCATNICVGCSVQRDELGDHHCVAQCHLIGVRLKPTNNKLVSIANGSNLLFKKFNIAVSCFILLAFTPLATRGPVVVKKKTKTILRLKSKNKVV